MINSVTPKKPSPDGLAFKNLTTFYNGACPICNLEITHYQKQVAQGKVTSGTNLSWCDTSQKEAIQNIDTTSLDVQDDRLLKRLHVMDEKGRIFVGIDAFIALWSVLPRYFWVARVVRFPVIRPLASILYDHILAPALYSWNKKTGRLGPSEKL